MPTVSITMQNLPEESETLQRSTRKKYYFTFGICKASSPTTSVKSINGNFVAFFTAIRMHEWPRELGNVHANKLFLHLFFLELRTEQYLSLYRLDFRRSLVSGLPSPRIRGRSAGSFPEQRLVIEPKVYKTYNLLPYYKVFKTFSSCSVCNPKTNKCRINLFVCRFACYHGHPYMRMRWLTSTKTPVLARLFFLLWRSRVIDNHC